MNIMDKYQRILLLILFSILTGCSSSMPLHTTVAPEPKQTTSSDYIIGPGDSLQVFVWRNPELSATIPVRPDGKITTPLIEDVVASGKTPSQLAREMEQRLSLYVKNPVVTVSVTKFIGRFSEQIRVVGEAAKPQSLAYRKSMTLLDVLIDVGGLTEFADGNDAKIIRTENGKQREFGVRLDDLVKKGDITANVKMKPGDILIIPESWF
jgi:polysaccharide biosynthesis/export protein